MITITAGQTRKGTKIHQHRNGWATCGAGRITTTHHLETSDAGKICKRCADKLRNEIIRDRDAAQRITRDSGCMAYAATLDAILDSMLDSSDEDLLAQLIADMNAMYA